MEKRLYEWGSREHPTIVCLHGMGSAGLSFGEMAQFLSADFHIAAFDLPGCGGSEPLHEEEDYLPSRMADRIAEAIETLDQQKVYVMGHSWGAHLALYFAKAYSERIKGLILLDGGYLQDYMGMEEHLRDAEAFYETVRFPSWKAFIESEKSELPRSSEELEMASRAQVTEIDGEIRLAMPLFVAKALIKGIYAEPTGRVFSEIGLPVLLLRSTLPVEMEEARQKASQQLVTEIHGAEVHAIVNTTHDIYRDAPEKTAKNIKKWIRQKGN